MPSPAKASRTSNLSGDDEEVSAYSARQRAAFAAICDHLRALIQAAIPKATSKVWHGSPVWFIGGNPVVGYNTTAKSVNLLFWNGQAFGEDVLKPVGKYGAAQAIFALLADVDDTVVKRWLRKAKADVFDSKEFFRKMRAGAK